MYSEKLKFKKEPDENSRTKSIVAKNLLNGLNRRSEMAVGSQQTWR